MFRRCHHSTLLCAATIVQSHSHQQQHQSQPQLPAIFSSPQNLLEWTRNLRNNRMAHRRLSNFLVATSSQQDQQHLVGERALTCCVLALRTAATTRHDKSKNNLWAASLAICHAAMDAAVARRPLPPFPEDIAAEMLPVFVTSGGLWEHAMHFANVGVPNLLNANSENSATLISSVPSALLRVLLACNRREEFLRVLDARCDRIPSGHIPQLMVELLLAFEDDDEATTTARALNLASIYLARGGDVMRIAGPIQRVTRAPLLVQQDSSLHQHQHEQDPRVWERRLRSLMRSRGEINKNNNNSVDNKAQSINEFVTKTLRPNMRLCDARLQRVLASALILGDELTLDGDWIVPEKAKKAAASQFPLHWSRALHVVAQISSLVAPSSSSSDHRSLAHETEQLQRDLSIREILAHAMLHEAKQSSSDCDRATTTADSTAVANRAVFDVLLSPSITARFESLFFCESDGKNDNNDAVAAASSSGQNLNNSCRCILSFLLCRRLAARYLSKHRVELSVQVAASTRQLVLGRNNGSSKDKAAATPIKQILDLARVSSASSSGSGSKVIAEHCLGQLAELEQIRIIGHYSRPQKETATEDEQQELRETINDLIAEWRASGLDESRARQRAATALARIVERNVKVQAAWDLLSELRAAAVK